MLIYLLKSGMCLGLLFAYYKIFMEGENMHSLKRFYLIGALLFSLVMPLVTISYTLELPAEFFSEAYVQTSEVAKARPPETGPHSVLFYFLSIVYISGFLIMGYRFTNNLLKIAREIRGNETRKEWNYIYVLLRENLIPHTFLNYIFLNKSEYEEGTISESVLDHEKAHVDQKHSLDVVFIEFLQVIFWFNPLIYFWKHSIKLNHEFLADRQVLSGKNDPLEYSELLLNYNHPNHQSAFSSHINSSLIKKRIIMISKDFSIKRMLLKLGLLLPVLALCVYLFNNEIVAKPVYTNSELSPVELQVNPQDANVLKIKMEGESIYLNGKEVKLKKLVSRLDKMAEGKSDGQLKEMNFDVKISNTNKEFIKDVDREFRRSRLARITGFSLVPPPPAPSGAVPAPSAPPAPGPPNGQPSTTPSVPEPGEKMKVLPAPPVHSHPEQDSVRRLARMEMSGEKISERMDMKRAKLEELRAERMELRKEKMDSVRAKRDAIYEEKMAERMEIVEKRHAELRKKQAEMKTYIKAERDRVKANMKKMQQQEKKKAEKENLGL